MTILQKRAIFLSTIVTVTHGTQIMMVEITIPFDIVAGSLVDLRNVTDLCYNNHGIQVNIH